MLMIEPAPFLCMPGATSLHGEQMMSKVYRDGTVPVLRGRRHQVLAIVARRIVHQHVDRAVLRFDAAYGPLQRLDVGDVATKIGCPLPGAAYRCDQLQRGLIGNVQEDDSAILFREQDRHRSHRFRCLLR